MAKSQFDWKKTTEEKFRLNFDFRFVLVCGHITFTSMENFLKDFLHEDRVSSDSFCDADVLIVDKFDKIVDKREKGKKNNDLII